MKRYVVNEVFKKCITEAGEMGTAEVIASCCVSLPWLFLVWFFITDKRKQQLLQEVKHSTVLHLYCCQSSGPIPMCLEAILYHW